MERWRDLTGADYPFCFTDETTLKTIIRSNPGLLLLKNGTVIQKWSHNRLPTITQEQTALRLEQLPMGKMPTGTVTDKLAFILMWYVLPLTVLTLGDRLWTGGKWLLRRHRARRKGAARSTTDDGDNRQTPPSPTA